MYIIAVLIIPATTTRAFICMIQGCRVIALQGQIVPVEKKNRAGAATPDAAKKNSFEFSVTESEEMSRDRGKEIEKPV